MQLTLCVVSAERHPPPVGGRVEATDVVAAAATAAVVAATANCDSFDCATIKLFDVNDVVLKICNTLLYCFFLCILVYFKVVV